MVANTLEEVMLERLRMQIMRVFLSSYHLQNRGLAELRPSTPGTLINLILPGLLMPKSVQNFDCP